jgi:WD repeat-containing protein 23
VLNRAESLPLRGPDGKYTDPSSPEPPRPSGAERYSAMPYEQGQSFTVRDVSWHGFEPTLMSTSWEVDGGYRRGGTLAKHEWKGLGKGGMKKLEDWVERELAEEEG